MEKSFGKSSWQSVCFILLLLFLLQVFSVKCVADTYLRIVINGGLWRCVIFYYVWNCKNAFLACSYILFSLNIYDLWK